MDRISAPTNSTTAVRLCKEMSCMGQTTVNVRVDEDVKRGIEEFCGAVGMNISVAVNLFFKAVLNQGRIPFEIAKPEDPFSRSREQIDVELEKGWADIVAGRVYPLEEVFEELDREFDT